MYILWEFSEMIVIYLLSKRLIDADSAGRWTTHTASRALYKQNSV